MTTTVEKPTTAEEAWARGSSGRFELVHGRIIEMSPAGFAHGWIIVNLGARMLADCAKLGTLVTDVGFIVARNPDTVRAPDLAFVSFTRLPRAAMGIRYAEVAPELCIEVLSPTDRWSEMLEKVDQYLAFGVDCVWVLDPRTETVTPYEKGHNPRTLHPGDTLRGGEALGGFAMPVRDLFAR